ncbi:VOC family protein [Sphingomicrobium sp. XHP0235]|uniref:VOC family protein n=1 Tax=Sphingomicrobium aquimarinum TaxID=3133971 RepID=UPI0031FEF0D4
MPMRIIGIGWMGVGTDDHAEMHRFFSETLGLTVDETAADQSILSMPSGQQVEIFGRDGPGKRNNTPPTIAFTVEDFDDARDHLVAEGVELVGEPGSWAGHRWQYFRGPDGTLFFIKVMP